MVFYVSVAFSMYGLLFIYMLISHARMICFHKLEMNPSALHDRLFHFVK